MKAPHTRIELYDSMSGEECGCCGIAARLGLTGAYIMVMPDSYCRTLTVDETARKQANKA